MPDIELMKLPENPTIVQIHDYITLNVLGDAYAEDLATPNDRRLERICHDLANHIPGIGRFGDELFELDAEGKELLYERARSPKYERMHNQDRTNAVLQAVGTKLRGKVVGDVIVRGSCLSTYFYKNEHKNQHFTSVDVSKEDGRTFFEYTIREKEVSYSPDRAVVDRLLANDDDLLSPLFDIYLLASFYGFRFDLGNIIDRLQAVGFDSKSPVSYDLELRGAWNDSSFVSSATGLPILYPIEEVIGVCEAFINPIIATARYAYYAYTPPFPISWCLDDMYWRDGHGNLWTGEL